MSCRSWDFLTLYVGLTVIFYELVVYYVYKQLADLSPKTVDDYIQFSIMLNCK